MKNTARSLINKNRSNLIFLLLLVCLIQSCENSPNDLGYVLLPTTDTNGVRMLDSQTDSMQITSNNYKEFINTSGSKNMLVGYYQNYQAKALLKFTNIDQNFDSAKVLSAILVLRNSGYFFKDNIGLTSFNLYRVNTNFNYSAVTFDSVSSSDFGSVTLGSYSGNLGDTGAINITLDNQTAKDWLEYAADSGYAIKNYGIGLIPNLNSNTIKGFYSGINSSELIPNVEIIFTKNNIEDTIILTNSEFVSLSDAPYAIIPADRFILQNGIAYRNILNFDLNKLPDNVIINNATLLFTLDTANSFISSGTDTRIVVGAVTDSVTKSDSLFFNASIINPIEYSVNIGSIVQRWNSGIMPNLGVTMKNYYELQNLDNFVFYLPASIDASKQPRLKITYTLIN